MVFIALAILAYTHNLIEVFFISLDNVKVDSKAVLGQWSQASPASFSGVQYPLLRGAFCETSDAGSQKAEHCRLI